MSRVKMAEKMVRKGFAKEDDVLSLEDKTSKRKSVNDVNEKQKSKKSADKSTPSTSKNTSMAACSPLQALDRRAEGPSEESTNDNAVLAALKTITENQKKQDNKINILSQQVSNIMNDEYYYEQEYDHDENENYLDDDEYIYDGDENESEPPNKKQKSDKTTEGESEKSSRFFSMTKRFKVKEVCGEGIDEVLAQNVTSLFLNGMDEEQYSDIFKDEKNARPENCEGLKVVKTNQLIWDILPPFTQTCDKKMQNIEKTVVKAATVLTNAVNKMAKVDSQEMNDFIESCNDTLALMGHANRQINLARREFMKPDLDSNYVHLCAQSVPYTSQLFGDDVSKAAKDIEDTRKIGNRMSGFGFPRGRGYYRGGIRGRGSRRGGRFRSRGFRSGYRSVGNSGFNDDYPKNFPKRGSSASGRGRH